MLQQAPCRNASVVGAHVYSHSGELSFEVVDLELRARRIGFRFVRTYGSARAGLIGALGRGWTFTYTSRLEAQGDDVLYHDGRGRTFTFQAAGDGFASPDGVYAALAAQGERYVLHQPSGDRRIFGAPAEGGRLLAIEDAHGNALRLDHRQDRIVVTDPFDRQVTLVLHQARVAEMRDHVGRTWRYGYDDRGCLVEVGRPLLDGQEAPAVRYAYDDRFRLVSITDPNGATFLRNTYDGRDRVRRQVHGDGAFEFEYDAEAGTGPAPGRSRTRVRLKNGARLEIRHDADGHAVETTLHVAAAALDPEDRGDTEAATVPLTTTSAFNRHGERTRRTEPAGNATEWVHDQDNADPRPRGNLLRVTRYPRPGSAAEARPLSTVYTYEPKWQSVQSVTDARGHTTRFAYDERGRLEAKILPRVTIQEIGADGGRGAMRTAELHERFAYNEAGQLTRHVDARGAVAEYFYYPLGARAESGGPPLTQAPGGYLARIVRDADSPHRRLEGRPANATVSFEYDAVGNLTAVLDGNGQATRYRYDAHDRMAGVTSRPPLSYERSFRHDANGNLVEGRLSFDYYRYDAARQEVVAATALVRQTFEHDRLNQVVRRTVASGDHEIVQTLVRDAAGNVVRDVGPAGHAIEYDVDERGLPVRRRFGAGTGEQVEVRHAYSANGRLRSTTDAQGRTEEYHYDPFDRYQGHTDAAGTAKRQWRDEVGNVTRIAVTGAALSFDARGEPVEARRVPLVESWLHFDELSRLVRVDRAWRDLTAGVLGRSGWDGREGVVSQVVQYGDNHRPARLWTEPGSVVSLEYDGVNRLSAAHDAIGEAVSVGYDGNGNPIRFERLGPVVEGEQRFRQVWGQEFDALDRPVVRAIDGSAVQRLAYNSLGRVVEDHDRAGHRTVRLHDGFGRPSGWQTLTVSPLGAADRAAGQVVVERVMRDDGGRLAAFVNARGYATRYRYDALDRVIEIVHADGTSVRFTRSAGGDLARIADASGTVLTHRFDALGRLVQRAAEPAPGVRGREERFHYDGLGRLTAAVADGIVTTRRYDSLSRLVEEAQSGRAIRYAYDAAGNRVRVRYPSGREIERRFDARGRVLEVRDGDRTIASYRYSGNGRPGVQELAGLLTARFSYEPATNRLSRLTYRSVRGGDLVEGRAYRYDARGNPVQSVALRRGEAAGDSYAWDSLDRVVLVRYDVDGLSDPDGRFAREVHYALGPSGLWQAKTTRDGSGRVLEQARAEATPRENYVAIGERHFRHDANANRIEDDGGEGGDRRRYAYDQDDRLARAERVSPAGAVVESIEYGYDALGRQVSRRLSRGGSTRTSERVWDGTRLAEEWEDGRPVQSLVFGAAGEPLELRIGGGGGRSESYAYTHDGLGAVTGLVDAQGRFLESGALDVAGQPRQAEEPPEGDPRAKNPLLVSGRVWDADARLFFTSRGAYDPSTMRFLDGSSSESIQGSKAAASAARTRFEKMDQADAAALEDAGWAVYLVGIVILIVAPNPFAKAFGLGVALPGAAAIGVGKYGQDKGKDQGRGQDDSKKGSSNQDDGQKKDDGNQQATQETPPEHPNKDDYHKPEKHPHVDIQELPVKGTPNPDDGTDEGFDKDFWRNLPFADPQEVLEQLRTGPKVDERGETVEFRLPAEDLDSFVTRFLTPQPITVDEGGEGVTINFAGAHSENPSAGIAPSDGWGDKPRTLAEAYAAPRIRESLIKSRF